jgi:hypothetical protein
MKRISQLCCGIWITSIASNVEVDYRFAKSEFITAKKLLEDMADLHFTNKK